MSKASYSVINTSQNHDLYFINIRDKLTQCIDNILAILTIYINDSNINKVNLPELMSTRL